MRPAMSGAAAGASTGPRRRRLARVDLGHNRPAAVAKLPQQNHAAPFTQGRHAARWVGLGSQSTKGRSQRLIPLRDRQPRVDASAPPGGAKPLLVRLLPVGVCHR